MMNIWVVVSNICYFHPYLGKWSNLTNIFQLGWNRQLVFVPEKQQGYTPPKNNMEPENDGVENEFPLRRDEFQVPC